MFLHRPPTTYKHRITHVSTQASYHLQTYDHPCFYTGLLPPTNTGSLIFLHRPPTNTGSLMFLHRPPTTYKHMITDVSTQASYHLQTQDHSCFYTGLLPPTNTGSLMFLHRPPTTYKHRITHVSTQASYHLQTHSI